MIETLARNQPGYAKIVAIIGAVLIANPPSEALVSPLTFVVGTASSSPVPVFQLVAFFS
ncbi:MAG: hypothetical protein ACHQ1H_10730 [Nitrososphaerales archaeon]